MLTSCSFFISKWKHEFVIFVRCIYLPTATRKVPSQFVKIIKIHQEDELIGIHSIEKHSGIKRTLRYQKMTLFDISKGTKDHHQDSFFFYIMGQTSLSFLIKSVEKVPYCM